MTTRSMRRHGPDGMGRAAGENPPGVSRDVSPRRRRVRSSRAAAPVPPWESFSVAGPDGSLHVRRLGSGPRLPILFVHGLAGHGRHWTRQVADLAADGHRVAAPDLRGHGRSDPSGTLDYRVEAYASDLEAVVETLAWRRFVVVGHSLGAAAAIEYAARHAGRVVGLVLVDPSGDSSRADPHQVAALVADVREAPHREFELHFRQFLVDSPPEVAESVLADLVATPPEVLAESFAGSMTYPAARRLRDANVSAAFLVSTLNRGPDSLPALFPEITTARVVPAGHWLMLDRPELVSRFVAEQADAWEGS